MNFLVFIYFLVFSVCFIFFHFLLFLSNFTPFGRVVFFPCLVFWFVLAAGVSSSRLEIVKRDSTVSMRQGVTLEHT